MIGRIYKIEPKCQECDIGDVYFGATCRNIDVRYKEHIKKYLAYKGGRPQYKFVSSYTLFEKYGIENCRIVVMEEVVYEDVMQVRMLENNYIVNNLCVNQRDSVMDLQKRKAKKKIYFKEWKRIKHQCDCGGCYTNKRKVEHMNTNKHRKYAQQIYNGSL
jgi:hypothetical protein